MAALESRLPARLVAQLDTLVQDASSKTAPFPGAALLNAVDAFAAGLQKVWRATSICRGLAATGAHFELHFDQASER